MRIVLVPLATLALAKASKLAELLDLAKGKVESEALEGSLYSALKAKLIDDDGRLPRLTSSHGSHRFLEKWDTLWADGSIPERPPLGIYPGGVLNSAASFIDLTDTPAFEGLIMTWDCGNGVSLAQALIHNQQGAQAGVYTDAVGAAYGVPGLITDFTVAGQERCPIAIPVNSVPLHKEQIIIWRRVVGSPDTLVGKIFNVNSVTGRATPTSHMRVLKNIGQTQNFQAIQLLTGRGHETVVYAAAPLTTPPETASDPVEFPLARSNVLPALPADLVVPPAPLARSNVLPALPADLVVLPAPTINPIVPANTFPATTVVPSVVTFIPGE